MVRRSKFLALLQFSSQIRSNFPEAALFVAFCVLRGVTTTASFSLTRARARAHTHTHDSHELNYQGAWDAARRLWLQNNTEDCLHCLHKIANSPAEYGEEVAERHKLRLQSLGEWQDEEWGQGGAGGAGSTRVGKPETQAEWTARV